MSGVDFSRSCAKFDVVQYSDLRHKLYFLVELRNEHGVLFTGPFDKLVISLVKDGHEPVHVDHRVSHDGLFIAEALVSQPADYTGEVKYDKSLLPGFPKTVSVAGEPDVSKCEVTYVIRPTPGGLCKIEFTADIKDSRGVLVNNPWDKVHISVEDSRGALHVSRKSTKERQVLADVVTNPGEHTLDVTIAGQHFRGFPHQTLVRDAYAFDQVLQETVRAASRQGSRGKEMSPEELRTVLEYLTKEIKPALIQALCDMVKHNALSDPYGYLSKWFAKHNPHKG